MDDSDSKHAQNIAAISSLHDSMERLDKNQDRLINSLDSFKDRIATELGAIKSDVQNLKGEMNILLTVGRWIFAPVFSVMGLAVVGIIAWWLFRRF